MVLRPTRSHPQPVQLSLSKVGRTPYVRIRPIILSVAFSTIVLGTTATARSEAQVPPAPTTAITSPTSPISTPRVAGASPDGADLPYLGDPRLDPDLGGVAVDTPEFRRALETYRSTRRSIETAKNSLTGAMQQLVDLEAAQTRLVGQLNQATRRKEKSDARLAKLRDALADIAVNDYMRGDSASAADLDLDLASSTDFRRRRVVLKTVRSKQLSEAHDNTVVVNDMTDIILATQAELDDVRARLVSTTATREQAVVDQKSFESVLVADAKTLADARMTGNIAGLDFPIVVLDAYYKAAKRMKTVGADCGIKWTLIAGISRTEGRHGTYNGSSVDADGNETKPILGIALDGSNNTATVPDSDGGELDGDPLSDRAVGPMQFIPSTWKRWGRDGNNDGRIDPQNMYDAALAAAAYLCYFGPGLGSDDGIRGSVIHYNASNDYVELVLSRAKGYDEFSLPSAPKLTP